MIEKRNYPPPFIPNHSQKKTKACKKHLKIKKFVVPFFVSEESKQGEDLESL